MAVLSPVKQPEYSLEGLRLKLQYIIHLMQRADSLEKNPDAGKDWRQEEKGTTKDEMDGWYHRLNGHEFEQASGVGDGQGGLVCCSPWGCKESDTTERLNNNNRNNSGNVHQILLSRFREELKQRIQGRAYPLKGPPIGSVPLTKQRLPHFPRFCLKEAW